MARKKKSTKGQRKVQKVMHEYKAGTLHSSSGQKVTKRSQAIAIASSEKRAAEKGRSRHRKKKKK